MFTRNLYMLLVCLFILVACFASEAPAWNPQLAALTDRQEDLQAPPTAGMKPVTKVNPHKIVKCKPLQPVQPAMTPPPYFAECILPEIAPRGWKFSAEAIFGRARGKVVYFRNYLTPYTDPVDLNGDMGLPEHTVAGIFSAQYRFQPQWSVRYSISPMVLDGSGTVNRSFTFGANMFSPGQNTKIKWERLLQRVGIVFDPIRTPSSRISIFGDYVRMEDKLTAIQVGCCGDTMHNDLNMGMAGIEFERCLKTTRSMSSLSLECKAGVAFGDDAFGSDLSTSLKYSVPMAGGRWGYLSGGYHYQTYKKKYSDAKSWDTSLDGGFVQMGLIF